MSDRELPEVESGTVPLYVTIFAGLAFMAFAGLMIAVFTRGDGPLPVDLAEDDDSVDLKRQDDLLDEEQIFRVRFETSVGPLVMEVRPDWAPRGATQFRELAQDGFYDGCRFFRVLPGFVAQFGINKDPAVHSDWQQSLRDDPVKHTNERGTVTFATSGVNSRTTQLFINLKDNGFLDEQGFSPIGKIVEGMENVDKINAEYADQPNQGRIESEGNAYLEQEFSKLDYIESVEILD